MTIKVSQIGSNMTELVFNGRQGPGGPRTLQATVLLSDETPVAVLLPGSVVGAARPRVWRTSTKWSWATTKHINKWIDLLKLRHFTIDCVEECDQSVLEQIMDQCACGAELAVNGVAA